MTIESLIKRLEEYRDRFGGDAEVRLMIQPAWPFEYTIAGLASGEDINNRSEGDDHDEGEDRVVFILEGQQRCYGSRRAWEVAE